MSELTAAEGPPVEPRLDSFVLRFVRASESPPETAPELGGDLGWHGVVRHVQSSRERAFTRWSEAVAFIAEFVDVNLEAPADQV
jgi:hypothetical protein